MTKRLSAALLTVTLTVLGLQLITLPANAEVGEESHSDATFLDATLLTGDLGAVAGIEGAHADYVDTPAIPPSDVDDANLDTTALSALTLPLPDLQVGVGDLLQLGAVQQYAQADPNGASTSNTGTADLGLDLMALLPDNPAVTSAGLNLGAVGSEATLAEDGTLTRTTTIADATLVLAAPTVGTMVNSINGAITTLNTAVNGLQQTITQAVNSSVGSIINLVGGATGTANTTTNVTVNSRLDEAVSGLLNQTLSTDLVSLDLTTGQITVNLAGGIDLNNIPPNSTLLSPEILQSVSADIATLLGQLQADVNDILNNATDYIDITINSDTTLTDPIFGTTLGTLALDYTGTLGDLLDGTSAVTVDGTGVLVPLDGLGGAVNGILVPAISTVVNPILNTAVATAGTAVDTAVTGLTNTLDPVLDALGNVAQVNLNVQNESDGLSSAATVTAVQVVLLPGTDALELNLATSSVGPNVQLDFAPTVAATDTAAGDPTTITGGGWPANTEVTLQVTDPAGNPVGDPITVTTTADGSIPADTTYPIPVDSPPGDYTVTGTTASGLTATGTFAVTDETAPDAPVIETPADGSVTNDTTPTYSGTGEPGATINLVVDGTPVTPAEPIVVAEDGTWSYTPTTPLTEGEHTVDATQTDPAGNESPADSNTFTVDTTAPGAPVITDVDGDDATDGAAVTDDATPPITGTGDPGNTVTVIDGDGTVIGETTVGDDGTWTLTPADPLPEGDTTVTATQTDPAGNESEPSAPVTITVDTTAPDAPVITGPADGSTVGDNTPTYTGTAEPGTTVDVTVTDADGNTYIYDDIPVGADGNWSVDGTDELVDGPATVSATATDPAGNTSPAASNDFTVDTTADEAPVITSPTSGSSTDDTTPTIAGTGTPGSTVTVTTSDGQVLGTADVALDGNWSFDSVELPEGTYTITATQEDAAGNVSPESNSVIFTIDTTAPEPPVITDVDGDDATDGETLTNNPTPPISGTAEPGTTVDVTITNPDGTETVYEDVPVTDDDGDGVGEWTVTPDQPLQEGDSEVTVTATDDAGNTSEPSAPVVITLDTTAPDAPVIETPADGSTIGDNTPTISGTADPGTTVDVTVTDADGVEHTYTDVPVDAGGNWTVTVPDGDALADGPATVTATATDPAGNTSEPTTNDFTVDATAPEPPVVTDVDGDDATDGETLTNNPTPPISGTAEPGSTVDVTIENPDGTTTVIEDVPVDADGNWTVTPTEPLQEGESTVTVTATDPSGNTSDPSDPVTVTLDTAAPEPPVITDPADGDVTNDDTPTISGTGTPGDTITVIIDGTEVGETTVGDDGTWAFTPTEPLEDGEHTVEATATDPAGNTSEPSAPVDFTVDATASEPPVITSPTQGEVTGDTTPDITGTGTPGETVNVYVDGTLIGTTDVGTDGNWTLTPTQDLAEGDHTVTATQTDPAGNTSGESDPVDFTIDTTAPEPPVITSPADGAVTGDATPDITGTGTPGDTITVIIDGTEVGETTVGDDGTWTFTPTTPLADGDHTITATATDPAGNTSDPSPPVDITVDTTAPAAPVITDPAQGDVTNDATPPITGTAEPGSTVDITIDGVVVAEDVPVDGNGNWTWTPESPLDDGEHTVTVTATDEAGNTSVPSAPVTFEVDTTAPEAPVITSPADGDVTNEATPDITGTGEPGATVNVSVDDTLIGTTTVNPDGSWTLTPTEPLADGPHTVEATQTDEAGNESPASTPVDFTVDTTAPDAPVITSPADGDLTDDATPDITGTAEPGTTVDVTITNPDGTTTVIEDVPVDADGNWTVTPDQPLSEGDHTITVTATDEAGNTSEPSEPVTITVDTTAPDAPVITSPTDGQVLGDDTPTITGTGEPGATVDVTITDADGNEVTGTATVDENGDWSFTPDAPLADGDYTVVATQTDEAGNESDPSESVGFEVDTSIPAVEIVSPAPGDTVNSTTPEITGTGESGSTIDVAIDTDGDGEPDVSGTTTVDENGDWSFTPTEPLPEGEIHVVVTATDGANTATDEVTFTVDTTAPDAPAITEVDGTAVGDDGTVLTDNPTPPITGTGEPGATVEVTIDGNVVGTTTVDENGDWTFTPTESLDDGEHSVTVTQTDEAGNESVPSEPVVITVDTEAPAAPVITSPSDGDTVTDTTPEITGTGEAGDTITVIVDGEPVGQTTVDEDGNWSFTPDEPLPEGPHEITATETDEAGNTSEPSAPVNVTVDSQVDEPTITSPADGGSTTDDTPLVTGTGEPGSTVTVIVDGEPAGEVVVDDNGDWQFQIEDPLGDGDHTVTVNQTDPAGNQSGDVSADFTVTPPAPVITSPQDGDTTTTSPVVAGTGEPGATVTVFVDGQDVGSSAVGANGTWSFNPGTLQCGRHTITATQSTESEAASARTAARTVARTTARPITSPMSDPVTVDVACAGTGLPNTGGNTGAAGADAGTGTGDGTGVLPNTGLDEGLAALAGVGLGLLVAGLMLVRRRRVEEQ